ncbi:MAG: M20/M25/M40 family metallo-hydrolase [Candidatus Aminicenantes bacterium]|nr:M20/M25/M40 family metallo-hydrolase [Candidatus Aminicenantes bacterium]
MKLVHLELNRFKNQAKQWSAFLVVLLLFISGVFSQQKEKRGQFDPQAALAYIRDLASDSMFGRRSGHEGGEKAAEYIAARFKEWGIEPAGEKGTYFQNFTVDLNQVDEGVIFELITPKGRRSFFYGEDWRAQPYSGSAQATAEIIFVGYGLRDEKTGYNDYAGIDVKGKWVLLASNLPPSLAEKLGEAANLNRRIRLAQELGARGVLVFRREEPQLVQPARPGRLGLNRDLYRPDFAIISIENRVVDALFRDLLTDLRFHFQEIESQMKPMSLVTGVKAFISLKARFEPNRPTKNVLGKITGADPVLKDECVIIGAHMDHLGVDPLGEVMNGANDNASGTAVVMEMARVMKLNQVRPKRTIIFALWAAEELGLLGSRYYADHPLFPLEKTVAYLNLDMVGHGSGQVNFRGVYYGPEVWEILKTKLPKEILSYVRPGRGGPGGSDHSSFLAKGVPGFAIMTEGYHFKYHQANDVPELIKPELLKKTGEFVMTAAAILANEKADFFPSQRLERYHFRHQTLINYVFEPAPKFIAEHQKAQDAFVDLQLVRLVPPEGMSGDALRVELIRQLIELAEELKRTNLVLFTGTSGLQAAMGQGKTSVLPGLRGTEGLKGQPRWAEVLAKQGLYFIAEVASAFFTDDRLTEEGKQIIQAINQADLLLIILNPNDDQLKEILNISTRPIGIISRNIPSQETLEFIKKKGSALGLVATPNLAPSDYVQKLLEIRKIIGSDNLFVVNNLCLWEKAGHDWLFQIVAELIKAKIESGELGNLLSGNFLRLLRRSQGETSLPPLLR